ncbi:hypothetical protein ACP70R_019144 [Stipagrostis hirtigluma subsp. patula]
MDPSGDRAYEDFVPPHTMVREPAVHTLTVDLSGAGYKKEHIRVQMVHSHRRLIVLGERPVAGNRWSRFRLEAAIPDSCDTKGVHARFEKGVVRVTMPSLAPEPVAVDAGGQQETAPPAKPTANTAAATRAQDQKDVGASAAQQDGDRAAQQEEEKVRKQQEELRRASSAKDDAHGESAGVEGEVAAGSPSRGGYAFVHDRRKMATTVLGVVLVLISFGIYVKYSLWP